LSQIFGPVPSRRLGQSLGIDPVPSKTCNWNCIYCQMGRTTPMTNQRQLFYLVEDIADEVQQWLRSHPQTPLDWITLVGSGETMLYAGVGDLISALNQLTDIPIAVITNGSLLYLPEVRQELLAADAVMPSFDAGNAALHRKINRPHPEITFDRLKQGLLAFRQIYKGKFWVEVMLIKGMNDTEDALRELAVHLKEIDPDEIHLLQTTRPPAEPWVQPADEEGLLRASAILGEKARAIHPALGSFDLTAYASPAEAVLAIITRHPMKETELLDTLGEISPKTLQSTLEQLQKERQVQVIERFATRFWSASSARYPA
jgi:wyosine [tRNA(Phe)-imidazoG37] synthetase (radical SAM superfamily)